MSIVAVEGDSWTWINDESKFVLDLIRLQCEPGQLPTLKNIQGGWVRTPLPLRNVETSVKLFSAVKEIELMCRQPSQLYKGLAEVSTSKLEEITLGEKLRSTEEVVEFTAPVHQLAQLKSRQLKKIKLELRVNTFLLE